MVFVSLYAAGIFYIRVSPFVGGHPVPENRDRVFGKHLDPAAD